MKARLAHLWAEHKLLFLSFALALTITLFFIIRTAVFFVYWSDPAHRNQPLAPWMTPRYIGHSYNLPPEDILLMLGLDEAPSQRPTLDWIAAQKGVPVPELIHDLEQKLQQK